MLDRLSTIDELANAIFENAVEHGFHPPGQDAMTRASLFVNNQHGEVSEYWDAWRAGTQDKLCDKADKMEALGFVPLTQKEEELADQVIRALDHAKADGIDIVRAILTKHSYNLTRPYKHGKLN